MQRKDDRLNYAILQIPHIKNLSTTIVYSPGKRSKSPPQTGNLSYLASASTNISNEFIDKHKTFYNQLFFKMNMDIDAQKLERPQLNFGKSGFIQSSYQKRRQNLNNSEINFIELNKKRLVNNVKAKAYDDMFEEENKRRGLDPKKMIKGVDELVQRIERNFDRKTGKLRVPQSIHEWKQDNMSTEEGRKKTDLEEYADLHNISKRKLEKLKNAVKFNKPDPLPMDAPMGYDTVPQKTDEGLVTETDKLEYAYPDLVPKKKVILQAILKAPSQSMSPAKGKKGGKGQMLPKAQTEVKKKEAIKPVEVKSFTPGKVDPTTLSETDQKIFKKLRVFVEKGDEAIKKNVVRRDTVFVYEMNKKAGQAFTKKMSVLQPNLQTIVEPEEAKPAFEVDPIKRIDTHYRQHLSLRPIIMNQENKAFILENYYLDDTYKAQTFGESLAQKEDIKTLVLVNNKLVDDTMYELIFPYSNFKISIEIFRCVRNQIGPKFSNLFEKCFFRLNEDVLRELTLDGCTIDDESLTSILNTLLSMRSRIKYLSLARVGLNKNSIKPLKKLIGNTEYLVYLDISQNKIPAVLMHKLCKRLPGNRTLKFVNFSQNELSIQDNSNAVHLKKFATNNSCLTVLNLSHTGLNDFEISLIIEGAQASQSLMSIHLAGNMLTTFTYQNINQALQSKVKYYSQFKPYMDYLERRTYEREHFAPVSFYNLANYKKWGIKNESPEKENTKKFDFTTFKRKRTSMKEITQEWVAPDNIIYYRILDDSLTVDANQWVQSYNCWITERWRKIDVSFRVPVEALGDDRLLDHDAFEKANPAHYDKKSSDLDYTDQSQEKLQNRIKDMNISILIKGTFTRDDYLSMSYQEKDQMYHFIDYIPPGLHHYQIILIKENNFNHQKILVETDLTVDMREKEIKPNIDFTSSPSPKKLKKTFDHARSVFAEFRTDCDAVAKTCFQNDFKFIKLGFMHRPEDIEKTYLLLEKEFIKIKNVFLHYIANSPHYPFLNLESTQKFVKECEILDDRILIGEITHAFHLTNVEEEEQDDNPNTLLCRFEFFEIICRFGVLKFFEKRRVDTPYEGVAKLINEHILQIAPSAYEEYHEYRIKKIYTLEIDELMKANLDELEKIYKKRRLVSGLKFEDLQATLKEMGIDVPYMDFNKIFVYSKMTILNEEKDQKKYRFLAFSEFLEFLVRLADYVDENKEDLLESKLERLLVKILKSQRAPFYRNRALKI